MTDDIILPILVKIQTSMGQINERITNIECRLGQVEHKLVDLHLDIVLITGRLDKLEEAYRGLQSKPDRPA